ncbi:MAG TPA: hypothetical protein VJ521_14035, partial [Acidobacteriota bacterium]|nr:hypothetical protein [Acidobacteriota bacterium]
THWQDRYVENISRVTPVAQDHVIFEQACSGLSPENRIRLAGHLSRSFPVSRQSKCLKGIQLAQTPQSKIYAESFTREQWTSRFKTAEMEEKIRILSHLRSVRNPALVQQAVSSLASGPDDLVIEAVRYLRVLSGKQIGNDPIRWQRWLEFAPGKLVTSSNSVQSKNALVTAGFSAVQVLDDLLTARESGQDFLQLYLAKHFPQKITPEHRALVEEALQKPGCDPHSASCNYKRGTMNFFLALIETRLFIVGKTHHCPKIASYWRSSIVAFQESGQIGREFVIELEKILASAEQNRDGHLDCNELKKIVQDRG